MLVDVYKKWNVSWVAYDMPISKQVFISINIWDETISYKIPKSIYKVGMIKDLSIKKKEYDSYNTQQT